MMLIAMNNPPLLIVVEDLRLGPSPPTSLGLIAHAVLPLPMTDAKDPKDIPVTRAIGQFFGHLWHSASKPAPTEKTTISETTHETDAEIEGQKVILRKTTIEEIEVRQDKSS
jgi:hypothetical protein